MPKVLIVDPENSPNTSSRKLRLILKDTVEKFSKDTLGEYEKQAKENHLGWSANQEAFTGCVRVINDDWGDVTLKLSRATGNIYAVLNMANAELPGGLYLEGFGAQEENMYRRTNCHFYVLDTEMDITKTNYTNEVTDLINGVSGEVYLDVENPRICIKESGGPDGSGYDDLPSSDYFLFYELKSAADNVSRANPFNEESMRRKISAQLDTLKKANIRFVVLSAFGCGVFGNPAADVAIIYMEELQKHIGDFDDVVFAIYASEYEKNNNFKLFQGILDGIPLNEQLPKEKMDEIKMKYKTSGIVARNMFSLENQKKEARKEIKIVDENSDDPDCKCPIF